MKKYYKYIKTIFIAFLFFFLLFLYPSINKPVEAECVVYRGSCVDNSSSPVCSACGEIVSNGVVSSCRCNDAPPPTAVPPTATTAPPPGTHTCYYCVNGNAFCDSVTKPSTEACALPNNCDACPGGGGTNPTSTPKPAATLDAFTKNCATLYSSQSGISNFSSDNATAAGCADHVGNIDIGDYVKYNTINFGSGADKIDGRGANWDTGINAKIEVYIDSISATNKKGECSYPNPVTATSTNKQQWGNLPTCNLTSTITGTHALIFKFVGSGDESFVWFKFSPVSTTPVPTATPIVSGPTETPVPGCLCNTDNTCASACTFSKFPDITTYASSIKCSLSDSLFPATPSSTNKTAWCQKNMRTKGDADGDGVVLYSTDYLYYVAAVNGGKIPVTVNPDFNGDGEVGAADRAIVYKSLNP